MKSSMRLIKIALEYRDITELNQIPRSLRGIYALYKRRGQFYDLVYIGMSGRGTDGRIRGRLKAHEKNQKKDWTHFSYYEVWDNASDQEIAELEGLFRQLYRFDSRANEFNRQQTHRPLTTVRRATETELGLHHVNKRNLGL